MNELVKKAWLNALRSGKYKQGQGKLKCDDAFCCLGVLCDLHRKQTGGSWVRTDINGTHYEEYDFSTEVLPESVSAWAGLDSFDPVVPIPFDGADFSTLVRCNDEAKMSFAKIADIIEEHL